MLPKRLIVYCGASARTLVCVGSVGDACEHTHACAGSSVHRKGCIILRAASRMLCMFYSYTSDEFPRNISGVVQYWCSVTIYFYVADESVERIGLYSLSIETGIVNLL